MAKVTYIGNGNSKKVSKIYLGSGNTSHKILKGYIGVSGKARLFFSGSYRWNRYTVQNVPVYGTVWDYRRVDSSGELTFPGKDNVRVYMQREQERHFNPNTGYWDDYDWKWTASFSGDNAADYGSPNIPTRVIYASMSDPSNVDVLTIRYRRYYEAYQKQEQTGTVQQKGSFIDVVESENENAYPVDGVSGNYWYTRIS